MRSARQAAAVVPGASTALPSQGARVPSGRLHGDAHPRQEGPLDLRLVPPALAAWGAAALALDAPPRWVVAAVVVCVVVAGALLVTWTVRGRAESEARQYVPESAVAPGRRPSAGPAFRAAAPSWRQPWRQISVAAVLLCAAAGATSAALHGADLHRGPVPALARQYAEVEVELEVTSDPRLTRPRVTGAHSVPPSVMLDAEIVRVTSADGRTSVTRTPALVFAGDGRRKGGGPGGEDSAGSWDRARWLALLPSTRLHVRASLAPPLPQGDRIAAVLRVDGGQAPRVTEAPSGPQRLAGRLRDGLREATDGLPPDARALLPGLVVGDTSRVPPDLEEAFRATDLTHLLAVSGVNVVSIDGLRSEISVAGEQGSAV